MLVVNCYKCESEDVDVKGGGYEGGEKFVKNYWKFYIFEEKDIYW